MRLPPPALITACGAAPIASAGMEGVGASGVTEDNGGRGRRRASLGASCKSVWMCLEREEILDARLRC